MQKLILLILSFLFFSLSTPVYANLETDFQLGNEAYFKGDYKTAFDKWKPLAEKGYANVQHNLGLMYSMGQGVTQDDKEAVKWYRLSADQGQTFAQYNLGVLYGNGRGVPQDLIRAYKWFNIAEANGYEDRRKSRDIAEKRMTPDQIAEAQRLAREWMEKHQKK